MRVAVVELVEAVAIKTVSPVWIELAGIDCPLSDIDVLLVMENVCEAPVLMLEIVILVAVTAVT